MNRLTGMVAVLILLLTPNLVHSQMFGPWQEHIWISLISDPGKGVKKHEYPTYDSGEAIYVAFAADRFGYMKLPNGDFKFSLKAIYIIRNPAKEVVQEEIGGQFEVVEKKEMTAHYAPVHQDLDPGFYTIEVIVTDLQGLKVKASEPVKFLIRNKEKEIDG